MRTLALMLLACTACSLVATRPAHRVGAARCTTGVAAPGFDTLLAIGGLAFAAWVKVDDSGDFDKAAIPVAAGSLVVFGLSAAVGYARVVGCRRARVREGIAF